MGKVRFSEGLVNAFHAFAILSGIAFVTTLLWPESPRGEVLAFIRQRFFPQAVAFFLGFLALQIGEAEFGYGAVPVGRRVRRLAGLVTLGLGLVLPFLLIHRVEAGLPWPPFLAILAFLVLYGLFWSLAGHAAAAAIQSDGLRFIARYGTLLVLNFLPGEFGIPISPFFVLGALWEGTSPGLWGLALYGGADAGALGWWIWKSQRRSSRRCGGGGERATPSGPSSEG